MFDKLNPKSKRIVTLIVIAALGALDAYSEHCTGSGTCKAINIPTVVYPILSALGITVHYAAGPK